MKTIADLFTRLYGIRDIDRFEITKWWYASENLTPPTLGTSGGVTSWVIRGIENRADVMGHWIPLLACGFRITRAA